MSTRGRRTRRKLIAAMRSLPLRDRLCELPLRHLRAALDTEPLRTLVQLLLRVPLDVDAAVGRALAAPLLRGRLLRARVGRALAVLRHPAVADLLVRPLERRHRRAVGALTLAVLLDGGVVRPRERPLRLRRRALERVRQLRRPP